MADGGWIPLADSEDQHQNPTEKAMLGVYKELGMGPTLKTTHQHQSNVLEGKIVRPILKIFLELDSPVRDLLRPVLDGRPILLGWFG